jgi:hypothetical protein
MELVEHSFSPRYTSDISRVLIKIATPQLFCVTFVIEKFLFEVMLHCVFRLFWEMSLPVKKKKKLMGNGENHMSSVVILAEKCCCVY